MLTGEGADEMFGGYDIFKEAKIRGSGRRSPTRRCGRCCLKRLYPYLQNLQTQSDAFLQAFFRVEPRTVQTDSFRTCRDGS